MMTFYIKVKDGNLMDVKFQTFGCVAAIAVSDRGRHMSGQRGGRRHGRPGLSLAALRLAPGTRYIP